MKGQFFGIRMSRAIMLSGVLLVATGMASAIFGSAYSIYFHTPFPFRDMVETMEFLDGNPSIWFGESFTGFHSMEHRPALPVFIWYADRLLSGSSGLMPLLVSHAALSAVAVLAVWNWAPRMNPKVPSTWLVPAAALAMMFSLINWYNLIWEMQLHVAMSLLFLMLAAHCAARLSPAGDGSMRPGSRRNLLLAAFAGWAATFSFGYGLPAMSVITIHGMLARWPWRYVAVSVGFSVIFLATYYYFFSLGGRSLTGLDNSPFNPAVMIGYMARLLAGAVAATDLHNLAGIGRSVCALVAGLALLGLYVFGAARLYLRSFQFREPPSHLQSVSLIVTSACVAVALMTWLSRPEETEGLVERYYLVSTLFILSLPGLFVSARGWTQTNIKARIGFICLSCVFVVLSLLGHQANFAAPYVRWHAATVAAIGADMGVYLPDSNALIGPALHQWKSKTFAVWATHRLRLKERGRYKPFKWRGRTVTAVFDVSGGQECVGGVESIKAVPGYENKFVFTGWARHGASATASADWIVVADTADRIIGLGAPGRRSANGQKWLNTRFPDQTMPFANHSGIAGYLSAAPGTIIRFFTVKGDKVCEFAAVPMSR